MIDTTAATQNPDASVQSTDQIEKIVGVAPRWSQNGDDVQQHGCSHVPIGIIVVSFNTRELTLNCLQSVRQYEPNASVVVVDNASQDGSADAIAKQFPEVTLLRLPCNIGFGRANSLALPHIVEDVVVILNSDTILHDDSLQRCARRMESDESLGAVTPKLVGVDGTSQQTRHAVPTFRDTLQRALSGRPMVARETDFWIPGTCMVLNRKAVQSAGGLFDPRLFIYWEDADLCARLKNAGYKLDVVEDSKVTHFGGASGGGPNCTARTGLHEWYTFGRYFWFARHRPRWESWCLWLLEFFDAFRCLSRSLVRPERRSEWRYGWILLKTMARGLAGRSPNFAVPELHGRCDSDLVDELSPNKSESGESRPEVAQCGIVVIGRNEGERLRRSLVSVSQTSLPVVYVDSGSTDGSQQLAVDHGATLVELDLSQPFTAARARNAGWNRLLAEHPDLTTVQFLDGDCELKPSWLNAGHCVLERDPQCAIVCGVLKELEPERSVYNRLCQLEWRRPTGEVSSCGGIFLARADALIQSGGFDPAVIAGEEPELCVRLRSQNWNIQAVSESMASHDAGMTRFAEWWRRSVRAGFGYAQCYNMHGHRPEKFRRREVCSILFYGLAAPILASAAAWHTSGVSLLLCLLGYLRLYRKVKSDRTRQGEFDADASLYARSVVVGKFAQAIGVLHFYTNQLFRRTNTIIEYKQPADSCHAEQS